MREIGKDSQRFRVTAVVRCPGYPAATWVILGVPISCPQRPFDPLTGMSLPFDADMFNRNVEVHDLRGGVNVGDKLKRLQEIPRTPFSDSISTGLDAFPRLQFELPTRCNLAKDDTWLIRWSNPLQETRSAHFTFVLRAS